MPNDFLDPVYQGLIQYVVVSVPCLGAVWIALEPFLGDLIYVPYLRHREDILNPIRLVDSYLDCANATDEVRLHQLRHHGANYQGGCSSEV